MVSDPEKVDPAGMEPVYIQLARIMRVRLRAGEFPEGRAIMSQNEMAAAYGVSRGSVAKAMAILQAEGLVKSVKGKGIYVLPGANKSGVRKKG